jgi:abequosyltransferase
MGPVHLSVCIPTYNFGAFIGVTLDSIVGQATDEIEIVIVDGASTDNTAGVVQKVGQTFRRVRYYRRDVKGGVDADLATAVELAGGDYCWLMSGDDVLAPGAVARVLNELKEEHDVYLCNRTECDRDLRPIAEKPWLAGSRRDEVFRFTRGADFVRYFRRARSLGALFSYISSTITRRDKWLAVRPDERLMASHYAAAFRLFSLLQTGGSLKYLQDSLVLCRGGNDSFASSGMFARIALDLDGFGLLASRLFDDPPVQAAFKAVMRREHVWYGLAELKNGTDARAWAAFERKLLAHGYSRGQLFILRRLAAWPWILPLARRVKNTLLLRKRSPTGEGDTVSGTSVGRED